MINDMNWNKPFSIDEIPALRDLRQFHNNDEIYKIRMGTALWRTTCILGKPTGVEYIGVLLFKATHEIQNDSIVFYTENEKGIIKKSFVGDLQNCPAHAVFTTEDLANNYFITALEIFNNNILWQNDHLRQDQRFSISW